MASISPVEKVDKTASEPALKRDTVMSKKQKYFDVSGPNASIGQSVSAKTLAVYKRLASPPSMQAKVRAFLLLADDSKALIAAGDERRARGAVLELIEVALMVATTPCSTAGEFERKMLLLGWQISSFVASFGYRHSTTLVEAALRAERATTTVEPRAADAAAHARHPIEIEPTTERTELDIPDERLQSYLERADDLKAFSSSMMIIGQICIDRAILKREHETEALAGAMRMLADMIRRVCAISAPGERDGWAKVEVIDAVKAFYEADPHAGPLLAVMDAAISLETEAWFPSKATH